MLTVLSALLTQTALMAQTAAPAAAAPAARGGRGGGATVQVQGATAEQQAAVTAMEQGVATLLQAVTTARTALTTAAFAEPRNNANLAAKLTALKDAEQALASARATAFATLQAGASALTAQQVQGLVAAQTGGGGRAGGRGGAAGGQKTLLIWADNRNGTPQHEFTSKAAAIIAYMGFESGAYRSYIRSDSDVISYAPKGLSVTTVDGANAVVQRANNASGPNLGTVDAIFSMVHRETPLPESQKVELLRAIKEDGKGLVSAHTGLTAFQTWDEYGKVMGGKYGGHPAALNRPAEQGGGGVLIVENPNFPGVKNWPAARNYSDEWYRMLGLNRDEIDVVVRLDLTKAPPSPTRDSLNGDMPLAYAKMYGNGRIFNSSFSHDPNDWNDPLIQEMYFEAVKWALKITDYKVTPRPLPKDAIPPLSTLPSAPSGVPAGQ